MNGKPKYPSVHLAGLLTAADKGEEGGSKWKSIHDKLIDLYLEYCAHASAEAEVRREADEDEGLDKRDEEVEEEGRKQTKLKWEFFEKPMVSRKVMMADTALPERMKTTVLAQDIIRRERNTCRKVKKEVRLRIRNKMMMRLRRWRWMKKRLLM